MSFVVPGLPLDEPAAVFAVLLVLVVAAPSVAQATRVPDVVVLLLAGVLVGPSALGLLVRDGAVEVLGGAGLLYLMFLAGLGMSPDDLVATRRASVLLGVLTFLLPFGLGTAVALALGLAVLPAVLVGSCWASHTLLTYPQFQRAGAADHPAVTATVGATIITDVAALLVLVVVVRLDAGRLTPAFWASLLPAVVLLLVLVAWGLPRLTRRFFAGPGQDGTRRLAWVLGSLYVVAAVTGLVGLEPIIGAFLAGLALHRSVPVGGVLRERVELVGSALLVPLFLVATGMLVDLGGLLDPRVLVLGAAFTATACVGKLLAAACTGALLGSERAEVGAMFALSNSQAAATLAAVVVGAEAGLLAGDVVNAVVLVVLVTCVVAAVVAGRVAPALVAVERPRRLGAVVLAPVANPETATALLALAATLARADAGVVAPLVVAQSGGGSRVLAERRALLTRVVRALQAEGAEARPLLRVDATPALGITNAVAESEATLVVLGAAGESRTAAAHGGVVEEVLGRSTAPTLVLHRHAAVVRRVLVVVDGSLLRGRGRGALVLALRAAAVLAAARRVPVVVVTSVHAPDVDALVQQVCGGAPHVVPGRRAEVLGVVARPHDLVVVPSLAEPRSLRALLPAVLGALPVGAALLLAVSRDRVPVASGGAPAGDDARPRRGVGQRG